MRDRTNPIFPGKRRVEPPRKKSAENASQLRRRNCAPPYVGGQGMSRRKLVGPRRWRCLLRNTNTDVFGISWQPRGEVSEFAPYFFGASFREAQEPERA